MRARPTLFRRVSPRVFLRGAERPHRGLSLTIAL